MSNRQSIAPVPVENAPLTPTVLGAIAQLIQHLQPQGPPADPIAHIRALEDAYQNNWILGTSELAPLLKLAPKTLVRHDKVERYGFVCERSGQNGTELGWRIRKPKVKHKKKHSN